MNVVVRLLVIFLFSCWASKLFAVPITADNIVTVDGTDWAQVDLFTNLSWNDIDAVCPSGACVSGGMLNGYTMSGWRWASFDELAALLDTYLIAAGVSGENLLSVSNYTEENSDWAPNFLELWRPTEETMIARGTTGWTSDIPGDDEVISTSIVDFRFSTNDDWAGQFLPGLASTPEIWSGGWFYKSESSSSAPIPATIPLLGLALAALGFSRSRHPGTRT